MAVNGDLIRRTFCYFLLLKSCFFLPSFYSNKRSAQGDRLSAITMALQYGSESDEDAALAGRS